MLKSAILMMSLLLIAPSAALSGGSLSFLVAPNSEEQSQILRFGLQLYALRQDVRSGAVTRQQGLRNLAELQQNGGGNLGIIDQRGQDHQARLRQSGSDQAFGIFQSGRNTRANVVQTRRGQVGLMLQYGW